MVRENMSVEIRASTTGRPVFHEIVFNHPFGALTPELHIFGAVEKDCNDVGIPFLDLPDQAVYEPQVVGLPSL